MTNKYNKADVDNWHRYQMKVLVELLSDASEREISPPVIGTGHAADLTRAVQTGQRDMRAWFLERLQRETK